MADYYTNFSFIICLNSKEEQQQALDLFHQMQAVQQAEDVAPDFPSVLRDLAEDCWFDVEAQGQHDLWIHSEQGGVDAVCTFVHYLIKQFNLPPVSFEWSYDCNRPRTDAFGGGAAYITKEEIRSFTTNQWIVQQKG